MDDLENVIDFDVIRNSGVRLGIDPLGGASVNYWPLINEKYGLNIGVVRPEVDPTWRFMTIDHDGKIRMDPSSPYAMKGLVDELNAGAWDKYDLVGGTDPDADRHGIVCPNWGVMNPNHYIAVCVEYLFGGNRPGWPEGAAVGKTLVSLFPDRPRGRIDQREGHRSAGGLQVVRGPAVQRRSRLRRRGELRHELPAQGWPRVDHR